MKPQRSESEWHVDLLKEHYDERLNRIDTEFNRKLDGFPQEYATRLEYEQIRRTLEEMRNDHVPRRELDEIKEEMAKGAGRRTAFVATTAVIVTLLSLVMGIALREGLTRAEVSAQIQREAPWTKDKAGTDARIAALQRQTARQEVQIARLSDITRYFCRTRQPLLPGC